MDIETHLEQPPSTSKRKFFIVFDDTNGKIRRINSTEVTDIANGMKQAESTDPICKQLIRGNASLKKYGMIWDLLNNKWEISKLSGTLIIESKTNKLVPFAKDVDPASVDLFVNIFYNSNKILIEANIASIRKNKNLMTITEISLNETNALDIYITKKNDPDYLVHTLVLNPKELFTTGSQIIELDTTIDKMLDWNNISLYSKHVFNNYGWSLSERKMEKSKSEHVLQHSTNVDDTSHININVSDNKLYFTNKLSVSDKHLLSGIKKFRFIVCDETPDVLVGAIELSKSQLDQKEFDMEVDFNWPKKALLIHKYNNIAINIGEIK